MGEAVSPSRIPMDVGVAFDRVLMSLALISFERSDSE